MPQKTDHDPPPRPPTAEPPNACVARPSSDRAHLPPGRRRRTTGTRCTPPSGSTRARSTGRPAGQAFAHFAQSMQASALRVMRVGLTSATSPINAPYGTQVAAPRVLHDQRRHDEHGENDRGRPPHLAEEVEHLDVGDQAVRTAEEGADVRHRHRDDDVEEERKQDVLQAAQRDVEPARRRQRAAEPCAGRSATATRRSCRPDRSSCRTPCDRGTRSPGTRSA